MKSIKRISKVAIVATVAAVLIAAVGAYAYWSVQSPVNGNKVTSGTMEFKTTLDDAGTTVATPIDIKGIDGIGLQPGEHGLAATWSLTIGKTPSKGVNLAFAVSGVTGEHTLKNSVQIALLLCTGGVYNYWLTPDGPVALVGNPDDPAVYQANSYPLIDYDTKSWSDMVGYTGLTSASQTRHLKVYYYLPEDADKDSHDDTATFNVMVEALQNH